MTIEEYWARLVAAGLAPDWDIVWAYNHCNLNLVGLTAYKVGGDLEKYDGRTMSIHGCFVYFDRKQLRKDGVDLVELEWSKPTEDNIGEMCWLLHDGNISLTKLTDLWNEMECDNEVMHHSTNIDSCLNSDEYKILLATNGNTAPTEKDFQKVYGEV